MIDYRTNTFRNGFKQFFTRTRKLFENTKVIDSLIQQCNVFLAFGCYDHARFCNFFNAQVKNDPAYFQPEHTELYRLIEENPSAALAFFLIFCLLDSDAVPIIEHYLSICEVPEMNRQKFPHCHIQKTALYSSMNFEDQPRMAYSDIFETTFILPPSISNFCGREAYINAIHNFLHLSNENPHLFLYGMSGIGKTELAKKYASSYKSYYDVILFLNYRGSLRQLVCNDIHLNSCRRMYTDGGPESDGEYFKRKLEMLWGIASERILFIIDNFNTAEEPDLKEFLKGNYTVLFTTQLDMSENGYRILPVTAFENFGSADHTGIYYNDDVVVHSENLSEPGMTLKCFIRNCRRNLTEEELPAAQQLLARYEGHLFILELIAKQMQVSRMTATEMLDFLKNEGLYSTQKLNRIRHHSSTMPGSVYEFVKHIVDPQYLTPEEQYVLKNLALLPVSGIIDRELKSRCRLKNYETIEQLIFKSLIQCDRNTGHLFLHPLIRELILINLATKKL
ncbi:MAG: hypothetical protein ACI4D3_13800 [Lachnospiraceae bacterium]